jgi:hypothetical protein
MGIATPAWTPYNPNALPPPGQYDTLIDANLGQLQRGYGYDWGNQAGAQGLGAGFDSGNQDRAQRREDEDLGTGLGNIDYTRQSQTSNLQRNFDILASRQQSAFRAQGLKGGGVAQALARRKANQEFEQKPITDQYGTGIAGDTNQYGLQGRQLQLTHDRSLEDRTILGGQATQELGFGTQDQQKAAWAQALQNNPSLTQPTKPKNEFSHGAQNYQLYRPTSGPHKGKLMKRLPSGRLVARTDMTTLN